MGDIMVGPGGPFTAQNSSAASVGAQRMGRSQETADDIVCVLLRAPHSTLGLVLVDGGGIYTRGLVLI